MRRSRPSARSHGAEFDLRKHSTLPNAWGLLGDSTAQTRPKRRKMGKRAAPSYTAISRLRSADHLRTRGRGFKSCRARQPPKSLQGITLISMPDDPNPKRPHKLQDHLHGRDYDHTHDTDEEADHDHDPYEADGRLD